MHACILDNVCGAVSSTSRFKNQELFTIRGCHFTKTRVENSRSLKVVCNEKVTSASEMPCSLACCLIAVLLCVISSDNEQLVELYLHAEVCTPTHRQFVHHRKAFSILARTISMPLYDVDIIVRKSTAIGSVLPTGSPTPRCASGARYFCGFPCGWPFILFCIHLFVQRHRYNEQYVILILHTLTVIVYRASALARH